MFKTFIWIIESNKRTIQGYFPVVKNMFDIILAPLLVLLPVFSVTKVISWLHSEAGKCFTHSSKHDANNEPSEGPDADEGGGTAAGDLRQSPRWTQKNGQKPRLQQLALPTWTNNQNFICEVLLLTETQCATVEQTLLNVINCTQHTQVKPQW